MAPASSEHLIHQAYFGAVNGISHGQLASSLSDADLRTFLVAFTDRPGMVPPGVTLPPYLAAAVHGRYYLVSRTWPDTAVARPGMVFTHVLLLPFALAREVPDLSAILRLLLAQPPPVADRSAVLPPLPLPTAEATGAAPTAVPVAWLLTVQQLFEQKASAPVFVVSEAPAFAQLLTALWQGLPSALRTSLTWGIRFAPPGSQEAAPLLVNILPELAAKWRGKDVLSLDPTSMHSPGTALEQLVFGGEQQFAFRRFITELQLPIDSFRSLKLCQQAYELARKLEQPVIGSDELLVLVRLLNLLQPDADKAVALKAQALKSLAAALADDAGPLALALRNLPVVAFSTGEAQLGQAVSQSVSRLITLATAAQAAQISLLEQLAEADPSRIQPWWQRAAEHSFRQFLSAGTTTGVKIVWLGLLHSASTRAYILQAIPETTAWQQALQQAVPGQLLPAVAEPVTAFSIGRNWWELTAAVLGAAYAPQEALLRQLKAEQPLGLENSARLSRLANKVADTELVELALSEPNGQLRELAGERCGRNPALLAPLDIRQQSWRVIWSASLRYSKSLLAGLTKPLETIRAFLTEVASGQATGQEPLRLLAASSFANVLELPARIHLWERLPAALRPQFLRATLDALVEVILAGSWTGPVEAALHTTAQGLEFNTSFLHQRRDDPAAVLAVNAVLHNLQDGYLRDYLTYLPALDAVTAVRLGRLVDARRWQQAAEALFTRAKTNEAFRPALRECADLFGFWDKLSYPALFSYQAASQDAWLALEQLMKQLYDKGPDESGIWRRAGGDPAELITARSRAAQWEAAIRLLRQGGGGAITVHSLLQTARGQFPNNANLRALADRAYLFG